MKLSVRWLGWVVGAVLALFAIDCLLLHPAGRYQLQAFPGGIYRMDTTCGNLDRFDWDAGKWVKMEGKKSP